MKKVIILLFAVGLLLAGCKTDKPNPQNPFVEGTAGLSMNFIADAPPAEVFDNKNSEFEIALEMKNMGGFDVAKDKVKVTLSGMDPAEFGKTDTDFVLAPEEDIAGAKKDSTGAILDGTKTEVSLTELSYQTAIAGATLQRPIVANICYEYGTKTVADLCIVKDVLADKSSVCKVNEIKNAYSSGAPIQVTSFVERPAGQNKIEFEFTIENRGTVKSVHKAGTDCNTVRSNADVVKVDISGIEGIECIGLSDGYVTLTDNKKIVKCSLDKASESDYEKTLTIDLLYGISDDVSTSLLIKHVE